MITRDAKAVARQWVHEIGKDLPGFSGAFFHGSTNWLPDDAALPETSDLDVMVVLEDVEAPTKLGKFRNQGVLLEVSYLPSSQIASAEQILGQYQIAGSFSVPSIIADPTGQLSKLQEDVAREYPRRPRVEQRCGHARNSVLNVLTALQETAPLHDQVTSCSFAAGITTHILLVAGLENPTVRRRYLAVRELLAEYGHSDFYEPLLALQGCTNMTSTQAEIHLTAVAEAFDTAKTVLRTPYRFAADLTDISRPIAIDGSREMIESGNHREAVFWMVATYSRCQWVLAHDGTEEQQAKHLTGYQHLLSDLGILSFADRQARSQEIRGFLPQVWGVAETTMAANPRIQP